MQRQPREFLLKTRNSCLFGRQAGAGLVSIMIALFVIMVSVLGHVAMQVKSLRTVTASQLQTHAITIAYSISDGMRANRKAALAGDYDGALNLPATTVTCEGLSASCTASQIAAHDMEAWSLMLERLPAGMASVERTPVAGKGVLARVHVCWNEARMASAASCPPPDDANNRLRHYALEVIL
jgi:type IV pilus assembly protein PilV